MGISLYHSKGSIRLGCLFAIISPIIGMSSLVALSNLISESETQIWTTIRCIIYPLYFLAESSDGGDGSLSMIFHIWLAIIYFSVLGIIVSFALAKLFKKKLY